MKYPLGAIKVRLEDVRHDHQWVSVKTFFEKVPNLKYRKHIADTYTLPFEPFGMSDIPLLVTQETAPVLHFLRLGDLRIK